MEMPSKFRPILISESFLMDIRSKKKSERNVSPGLSFI